MKALLWDLTKECNLRCQHCYNADKYFNAKSYLYSDMELNEEDCLHVIDLIKENGFEKVHFLGGEPLLSKHLRSVIEQAKKYGLIVTMNSNAILLDDTMQDLLIDLDVDHFAASLDGASPETNDCIRGDGTFQSVCQNMTALNKKIKLRNSKMQTGITSTITGSNYNEIGKMPSIVENMGCDLLTFTTFIECGNGVQNKEKYTYDCNTIYTAIEDVIKGYSGNTNIFIQLDIRPLIVDYFKLKYNAKLIYNVFNSKCSAGEDIWYLEADGSIHPCLVYRLAEGIDAQKKRKFIKENVNICKFDLAKVSETLYWTEFLDKKHSYDVKKVPSCSDCNYASVCQPCPFDYGEYNKSVLECEWVKHQIKQEIAANKNAYIEVNDKMEIFDKSIFINDECVCVTNDITLDILELIAEHHTLREVVINLCEIYDENEDIISRDVLWTFYSLRNLNIVAIRNIMT